MPVASNAVAVPITTVLITRINRREAEIRASEGHALTLAWEQGADLNQLKRATHPDSSRIIPHGEWQKYVEANFNFSYRRAREYMYLNSRLKMAQLRHFDSIIEALRFIRSQNAPALTRTDAEYVLKINSLAIRGATPGERDNAEAALDGLAQRYGTTADNLVKKAEGLCPDQQQSAHMSSGKAEVMAPYAKMSKAELLEAVWELLTLLGQQQRQTG